MTKEQILNLIQATILNNRIGVISALKKSYVDVNPDIDNKQLFYVIEREFINGNGYLVYHLGVLMEKELAGEGKEKHSNWVQAVAAILPALGGLFGGGKDNSAAQAQAAAAAQNQQQMMMQFQMAQQQAEAARQQREEQARREDAARRRGNTLIIVGIVGAVIITGGIIAFVVSRNKKK